jgi:foldase protein PrsA
MVLQFEDAAFSMDIGKNSASVQTEYGYHIIKVVDRIEATEANCEDVKEEIKVTLFEAKAKAEEEYSVWLEEKTAEYEIEYLSKM